ncbi:RNA polymerase sigma factor [Chitinophaga flava]|uniref:RNA polymerase subunit sigma-70 n=1 Tax=Chitinophaga flava TaxID=2259036 RepID=A0A365Y4I7_9BACT|nr:sigma-70 family RNA polymerase sigma factor [Chitinophaga flava]RBL93502.1 RNA polymerase subunit sigma-70 [Chitinophaga flava]
MLIHHNAQFEAIYKDSLPRVARMVHQMGGHPDMAKDIFHDAVIIWMEKKQASSHTITSDTAYIQGIARILCIRRLKDGHHYLSIDADDDHYAVPADFYETPAVRKPVIDYLKSAGRKCLQLLQAFYYDKLSMAEIASSLQYKTQHVATVQKYKCLEKIREQVKQVDYEEAAL